MTVRIGSASEHRNGLLEARTLAAAMGDAVGVAQYNAQIAEHDDATQLLARPTLPAGAPAPWYATSDGHAAIARLIGWLDGAGRLDGLDEAKAIVLRPWLYDDEYREMLGRGLRALDGGRRACP